MSWLDDFLSGILSKGGTRVDRLGGPTGKGLNLSAAFSATPNPATGNVDVDIVGLQNLTSATFLPTSTPAAPASGATLYVDSADDGVKVITPGGVKWILPVPRGALFTHASGGSQTLTTALTFYVVQWASSGTASDVQVDLANNRQVAASAGTYEVRYSMSFTGTAGVTYTASVFVNGTEKTNATAAVKVDAGGDTLCLACGGFVSLAAADYVDIRVTASANSAAFALTNGSFTVRMA